MEVTMRDIERYMLYIKKELRLKEWTRRISQASNTFLRLSIPSSTRMASAKGSTNTSTTHHPCPMIPKARGGNTIFAIMKRFRTMLNWCVKTGKIEKSPFLTFQLQGCVYGTPFYLTIDELNTLYHYDFSSRPKLAIQRDIFVLQSNLGMRVGDFYGLTAANLVNDAIEYIPGKTLHDTGEVVRVPLTDRAKEIINRYSTNNSIGLMPFICEQKYNAAIKEMLRLAGINRIVTTLNPKTRLEEKHLFGRKPHRTWHAEISSAISTPRFRTPHSSHQ